MLQNASVSAVDPEDVSGDDKSDDDLVLSAGDYQRLEGHRLNFAKKVSAGMVMPAVALVNVRQGGSWSRPIKYVSRPTLITRSLLFDLVSDRIITSAEHWHVQGYGHPSMTAERFSHRFPFSGHIVDPRRKGGASIAAQRQMLGNSMHRAAITCWLIYTCLSTDKSSVQFPTV